MMIVTSWICFCCFAKRREKKKRDLGFQPIPRMRSSAGNKQTHIKASMTSETIGVGGEGARIERSDGTGPETRVEAEEVRPDVNWALGEASDDAVGLAVCWTKQFVSRGRWAGARSKTFGK